MSQITAKQRKAIEALALGETRIRAAEISGVTEPTIYNWLKSAEFREAIKRTAIDRAPELFSEAGILIDRVMVPGESAKAPKAIPYSEREIVPSANGHNGGADSFLP